MAELNGIPVAPHELQSLGLINYGHVTSMRVDDQHVRGLSHHLERLVRDCRALFKAELDREQVREYVRHAIADRDGSFVVRVTVYDPTRRRPRCANAVASRPFLDKHPSRACGRASLCAVHANATFK